MHPAMIQAALKVAGVSQADIARQIAGKRKPFVSATAVHSVIWGRTRSQNIERAIAEATGLKLEDLWPQWHDAKFMRLARKQELQDFRTAAVG